MHLAVVHNEENRATRCSRDEHLAELEELFLLYAGLVDLEVQFAARAYGGDHRN